MECMEVMHLDAVAVLGEIISSLIFDTIRKIYALKFLLSSVFNVDVLRRLLVFICLTTLGG